MDLGHIISTYISDPVRDVSLVQGGHINHTFLVTCAEQYILQRMNSTLYGDCLEDIEHNYLQYARACDALRDDVGHWECPEWLRTKDGEFFYRDHAGECWRMYRYIPSDGFAKDAADDDYMAVGAGLGKLHRILKACVEIRPIKSTEHIHDLSFHYRKYEEQAGSKMPRIEEFDRLIDLNIEHLLDIHVPTGYVIYGDAKIANMIFRNGEVAGFVDLDTIMKGSIFDDLADCIRSCCLDEDGKFDFMKVSQIQRGYEIGYDADFTRDAVELLGKNLVRNRFTLGIRYYTDYLAGTDYFADQTPEQKLERVCDLLIW